MKSLPCVCTLAVNLIKEKQCGKIKGRTCADDGTQRGYIPRGDSSPQTTSVEALKASFVMDAYEGRDVSIFDDPGVYFNTDMPGEKDTRVKMGGGGGWISCAT